MSTCAPRGLHRRIHSYWLAVSVSGAIGYVGLLVPHVMRLLFGSDHRTLLPTAALGGAIALVLADTLARTVVAPSELPVGAMTALAGALCSSICCAEVLHEQPCTHLLRVAELW